MSKGKGKFVLGTLLGGAVGAALGVLYAPKSGARTRRELKIKLDELWDDVRSMDSDDIKNALETKLSEIETSIKELDKEKVLSVAKEKSDALKAKCNELVESAKETGMPIIEDSAKKLKKELANVTKEILKKLED